MIPEFIGRLPILATLDELDENMLIKIMTTPKNALVKQFNALFKMDSVNLEIKKDALVEITTRGFAKTGARVSDHLEIYYWIQCINRRIIRI